MDIRIVLPSAAFLLTLALASCLPINRARRLQELTAEENWLTAGEFAQENLKEHPADAKVKGQLEILEQKVLRDADNLEFDPRRYFYAQAYLDYFKRQSYAQAKDDLEQVLSFDQDNEEVLRFIGKAQIHIKE